MIANAFTGDSDRHHRVAARVTRLAAAATIALGLSARAFASDSPLEGIPETAAILVRLKSPDASAKKLADFAGRIKDDYRADILGASASLGIVYSNPTQAGVDRGKDLWIVLFGESGDGPSVAFVVPTTDAEMAKKAVGDRFKFASYENWLVYSVSEDALAQFARRKEGKLKAASAAIDARSRALFDASDLSAYVNIRELRKVYRSQIDAAKQQVIAMLGQLEKAGTAGGPAGIPRANATAIGAMVKMYREVALAAFQLVEDSEGLAAGVSIGEADFNVETCLVVSPSSPTDRGFESNVPGELKTLGRFPAEKLVYLGVAGNMSAMMRWSANLSSTMLAQSAEQKKDFEAMFADMLKMKMGSMGMTMSLGNPNEGVMRMASVLEVDSPERMRDSSIKMAEALGSIKSGPVKQTVTVKRGAETIASHTVDVVVTKAEVEAATDPIGIGNTLIKTIYGPQGIITRITVLPGLLVQSIGSNKESMEELIKSLDGGGGVANQAAWSSVRARLGAKANVIGLVDAPRLATEIMRVLAELNLPWLHIDDAAVAELQKDQTSSYLGASLSTEPHGLRGKLHIPLEQAKGIAQFVEFVRKLRNGSGS